MLTDEDDTFRIELHKSCVHMVGIINRLPFMPGVQTGYGVYFRVLKSSHKILAFSLLI